MEHKPLIMIKNMGRGIDLDSITKGDHLQINGRVELVIESSDLTISTAYRIIPEDWEDSRIPKGGAIRGSMYAKRLDREGSFLSPEYVFVVWGDGTADPQTTKDGSLRCYDHLNNILSELG
jgi:hypothetical protein